MSEGKFEVRILYEGEHPKPLFLGELAFKIGQEIDRLKKIHGFKEVFKIEVEHKRKRAKEKE